MNLRWPSWIGVVVEDIEASRVFYRDVLGLREASAGEGWVWFDMGDHRLFELMQADPSDPETAQPKVQTGFDCDDIRATYDEMIARGVEAVTGIDGGPDSGGYWAYFRDPEGNLFEIKQILDS